MGTAFRVALTGFGTAAKLAAGPLAISRGRTMEPAGTASAPPAHDEVRAWFEGVIRDNYRLLYATAYRFLRSVQDAEDATQAAALKAYRSLDTLARREAVVGWLVEITRRAALDAYRRRAANPVGSAGEDQSLLDRAGPGEDAGAAGGFADDEREVLLREFNKLAPGQAEVLTLRHLEGLDLAQIAGRLGLHEMTVRGRLFRAYESLRVNPAIRAVLRMD
jgi:RNA polymerase sigma-70 factor, ECF subfamily